ncbi:MAG: ribosome biogenesis GTPase [Chlamydiales bacterium]|jgi:ribosome biogenesis GTPase
MDSSFEGYSEEELFPETRKQGKLDRKIASRTDRSKYKKTDRDQLRKQEESIVPTEIAGKDLKRGRILSITGLEMLVDCDGEKYQCVLRGRFKKDRTRMKNLVAVGDFVLFSETSAGEGVIGHIEERKTILSRADNISRRKKQILAANIEQVLITVSVVEPPLKPFLIDRYIIATLQGGMKPVIILNKMDLLEDEEIEEILRETDRIMCDEAEEAYKAIDIPIIRMSIETGEGMDDLIEIMKDKASVFSGQSGVGKTSLINLITGSDYRTNEVVAKTRKGSHTTTTARLLPLAFGGWCVDTPGIGSFGVWDLKQEDVEGYFQEIHDCGQDCKFANCSHRHEPGCAVIEAVEKEEISSLRFDSYHALIKSIGEEHRPR